MPRCAKVRQEISKIEKHCLECGKLLNLISSRDIMRKKYCSHSCRQKYRYRMGEWDMSKMWEACNTPEANAKKVHRGEAHPCWKKDRSKIKQKRNFTEEKWFFKEVIKERNFQCEFTGEGGELSVHHVKPVWKYPELIFDRENVVVILKRIHKEFHRLYGFKSTESQWEEYVSIRF